jgi:iron complex outermembrane receptor protein
MPRSDSFFRTSVVIVFLTSAMSGVSSRAYAQEAAADQSFNRLSIEQLSRIDVTSVSKRSEPLSETAAAIQVLTQDDLRRAGVVYLVEALRLADAMFVGQFDARTWIVQPRGLAINGANKMQVLLDGRSIYSPFYSGIFWDVQDYSIDDIERIEVIRGPGASLWGANAVNGVINVITKRASEATVGTTASVGAGKEDRLLTGIRHSGRIGTRAHYRAYGKFTLRDAQILSTGLSAEDPLRRGQVGFRADWDRSAREQITVQGDAYLGRLGLMDLPDTPVSGGNLLARWTHTTVGGAQWQVQAYYDRVARTVANQFGEKRNTFDIEVQHQSQAGDRHHLLWGGGYRVSSDATARTPTLFFDPQKRSTHLQSLFVQDEITLHPRLFATVGTKLEHNSFTGVELQPTGRLRFTPHAAGTLWGAVSRAVRMPTRFDSDIRFTQDGVTFFAVGDADFKSEVVVAYEAGYRTTIGPRLSLDVSTYRNAYDNLRSQELGVSPISLIVFGNTIEGRVVGVEAGATVQAASGVQLHGSYARLSRELVKKPGSQDISGGEGNDPRHLATLQVFTTPGPSVSASLLLRYVGELPSPFTPAYVEADVALLWNPRPRLELALVGQNLLRASHAEFPQAGPVFEEIQRNVYGRVTLRIP